MFQSPGITSGRLTRRFRSSVVCGREELLLVAERMELGKTQWINWVLTDYKKKKKIYVIYFSLCNTLTQRATVTHTDSEWGMIPLFPFTVKLTLQTLPLSSKIQFLQSILLQYSHATCAVAGRCNHSSSLYWQWSDSCIQYDDEAKFAPIHLLFRHCEIPRVVEMMKWGGRS